MSRWSLGLSALYQPAKSTISPPLQIRYPCLGPISAEETIVVNDAEGFVALTIPL
ncbi:hypothetical protein ABEW05_009758 [Botrytis cinerea]